jgi:catalase-peroxidase
VADVIVLAGNVGVEQAAKAAGFDVRCPSRRAGATRPQEHDRRRVFSVLEPLADGFRNWLKKDYAVAPRS